jgi:hypothetical protein
MNTPIAVAHARVGNLANALAQGCLVGRAGTIGPTKGPGTKGLNFPAQAGPRLGSSSPIFAHTLSWRRRRGSASKKSRPQACYRAQVPNLTNHATKWRNRISNTASEGISQPKGSCVMLTSTNLRKRRTLGPPARAKTKARPDTLRIPLRRLRRMGTDLAACVKPIRARPQIPFGDPKKASQTRFFGTQGLKCGR